MIAQRSALALIPLIGESMVGIGNFPVNNGTFYQNVNLSAVTKTILTEITLLDIIGKGIIDGATYVWSGITYVWDSITGWFKK